VLSTILTRFKTFENQQKLSAEGFDTFIGIHNFTASLFSIPSRKPNHLDGCVAKNEGPAKHDTRPDRRSAKLRSAKLRSAKLRRELID
jgi:hypothetical protein